MKKTFILLIVILGLTGCTTAKKENNEEENILNNIQIDDTNANYVCTIENDNKEYKLIGKYVIYLNKDEVTNINSVEIIESENDDTLNYFESYYLSNYDKISQYSGYEYNIDKDEGKLTINVKIDYQTFNIESYVTDYPDSIDFFSEDLKLTINKLLEEYEKQNIVCEKK